MREFSASAVPISYKGLHTQGVFTSVLKNNINLFSTNTRFCTNRFAAKTPPTKSRLRFCFVQFSVCFLTL